jgi:rRNA maturation endonuclease Nob1
VKIPEGMKVLFQGKADYVREIAEQLTNAGIKVVTGPIPGGWELRAWLAVASADAQRALATHQRHLDEMVTREGLPLRDEVIDFDAEETQCTACLTKFKTAGVTRCPDCGLNFEPRS